MEVINKETVDYGSTSVDIYRASGDLYDSWVIGENPDATYGGVERVPSPRHGYVKEVWTTYDNNGHSMREVELIVDGKVLSSARR